MTGDIEERLRNILAEELSHPPTRQQIHEATSLYGRGLGLDSLDAVSLITRLEEEFDVFFAHTEIGPSLESFGALLRAIEQKRRKGRRLDR
jgi:acyl carrier protein